MRPRYWLGNVEHGMAADVAHRPGGRQRPNESHLLACATRGAVPDIFKTMSPWVLGALHSELLVRAGPVLIMIRAAIP
jgi:hypothetical protein